jgi:hypothetical protein
VMLNSIPILQYRGDKLNAGSKLAMAIRNKSCQ